MNATQLLNKVFTSNRYKNAKAYVLCRETDPETQRSWIRALKRAGMYVKSSDDLLPGQDWELEVETWMRDADFVFALFDEKSATAESWFHKFVRIATDLHSYKPEGIIKLIPVRLDEGALQSRYQFVWLDAWDKKSIEKLEKSLARVLAQK